jgi:hypothetical protein
VESLASEILAKEVGASGAVVSEDELELDGVDPLLPGNDDFPARVSIGISTVKPNEDNKINL